MSRPKNYWYGTVKKMVMRYPKLKSEKSIQAGIYCNAIERTLLEEKNTEDSDMRVRAIQKVYFEKVLTIEGAAIEFGYSERQVRRWLESFVNRVGKNAGF